MATAAADEAAQSTVSVNRSWSTDLLVSGGCRIPYTNCASGHGCMQACGPRRGLVHTLQHANPCRSLIASACAPDQDPRCTGRTGCGPAAERAGPPTALLLPQAQLAAGPDPRPCWQPQTGRSWQVALQRAHAGRLRPHQHQKQRPPPRCSCSAWRVSSDSCGGLRFSPTS